ncbi:MAG: hypothetical protein ACFFBP_02925 [Promethearchaeota archaeon]
MFCDKCGTKFIELDQKFCQKCGAITKTTATTYQSGSQLTVMSTQSSSQIPKQVSGYQQKRSIPGKIGIHSKRSLAFGITSFGSCSFVVYDLMYPFTIVTPMYMSSSIRNLISIIFSIALLVLLVMGLVFGILARSNGNKAELFESSNRTQKAGKVMGLLGIIMFSLIVGTIVLLSVLSLAFYILRPYPYYYPIY